MNQKTKQYIKRNLTRMGHWLVRCRILPKRIILKTDGGICSQMHFYLVGRMIEKATGQKVTYDLNWYSICGTDCDGKFARNFDLLKIFPSLDFIEEKQGIVKKTYISLFYLLNRYQVEEVENFDWIDTKAPCYLEGYFHDPEDMYTKIFGDIFSVSTDVLPEDNRHIKDEILNDEGYDTCAIHIRRGDLTKEHPVYGSPATLEYFKESIRILSERSGRIRYFVFSDEPDWCRESLIPLIGRENINIVDINGSDRGWCDLILMSLCHHQITSQGSMGKYAALLRQEINRDGVVILPEGKSSEEWSKRFRLSITVGTVKK